MHRYYDPALTAEQVAALDRENLAVLTTVQAALGSLHPAIRALFVDASEAVVRLHFVVSPDADAECRAHIDDTVSAFNALTWHGIELAAVAVVHPADGPRVWEDADWRPVYVTPAHP